MSSLLPITHVALCVLCGCVAASSAPVKSDIEGQVSTKAKLETAASPSLVAVGDLHGDLDNAIAALNLVGMVDRDGRWTGGSATLVQTGDITDRGPDSKGLIEWMQQLEIQSKADGGRVIALLGNHEAMNLTGDWRYVDPGDIHAFGGLEARKQAFSADGSAGRWLRHKDAVAVVEGTVFVHGGVHPDVAAMGLTALNKGVRDSLDDRADPSTTATLLGPQGPLWLRDYVQAPEAVACPLLQRALTSLQANRMVVGHTTRRDGKIQERCDGRLHVIDIGIADHYGANLGVWTQTAGHARAVYPGRSVDLRDPS
ncbi:MAG: metallophosphoesterase [Myxococcota bacterium]